MTMEVDAPPAEAQRDGDMPEELAKQEEQEDDRMPWIREMRSVFSPKAMVAADGSINQDFFKPKEVYIVEDKKWGPAEKEALYAGIEKYGIGKWRQMIEDMLPGWDDTGLRVRASKMMGSQSLARYIGWKGNKAAVDAEHEVNFQIGQKLGCWKACYLVDNDNGDLKKYLTEIGALKK